MASHQCSKCGLEKPLADFCKTTGGRIYPWCIECKRAYNRAYAKTPKEKDRQRRMRQDPKRREYKRNHHRQYCKKYLADPVRKKKHKARMALNKAVNCGKVVKPTACEHCHQELPLTAHHHKGYDREHWLDVEWLCLECHKAEHV